MNAESFQTLAIVFSTPENLLVGISGAVRTKESHYLSKNLFCRKCCRLSHKQWMLELSNLCHCVQHPWKLTCMDFWSSRNKRKPLSKQKFILRKYCRLSHKQWMLRAFKPLPLCSAPLKTYLYVISGALGTKENHYLRKNVIWENAVEYLTNSEC